MTPAPAEPHPAALPETSVSSKTWWSRGRWLGWVVLVFAAHVALLFIFGTRKPVTPRAPADVPTFTLADRSSEWLALNDPTLFARPHPRDFSPAAGSQTLLTNQPSFRWPEEQCWLLAPTGELGMVFDQFMQTNRFTGYELRLKPPAAFDVPAIPVAPGFAPTSTLRVAGALAPRPLLNPVIPPSIPYADVLNPSIVQVVVDPAGNVVSTTLLPPGSGLDDADQRALELARALRFAPAAGLTLGRVIFNWHIVPPPATNAAPLP